jgi:prephenate dehydrogenase
MNILIIGYGRMGRWFTEQLEKDHFVAVMEKNPLQIHKPENVTRIHEINQISLFNPELVINAVNIDATKAVFNEVLPYLSKHTILSDITSIKQGIEKFYNEKKCRFVSTHPMFGPTFGNMENLKDENAIIIDESDPKGKLFFHNLYLSLGLNIHFSSFSQHDELMADSLSLPFICSLLFSANIENNQAPGTTYKKHLQTALGLISEDETLLTEVLLNPYTLNQIKNLQKVLEELNQNVKQNKKNGLKNILRKAKDNVTKASNYSEERLKNQ